MATSDELTTADLERLARAEALDLAEAVLSFLEQPDKAPEKLPQGALTFDGLRSLLSQAQSCRSAEVRHTSARDAWQRFLAQKDVPPPARFALADLLVSLYERNSSASRAVLFQLVREADLRFGLWGGLKRIYKLAEERHDAEMFGVPRLALRHRVLQALAHPRRLQGHPHLSPAPRLALPASARAGRPRTLPPVRRRGPPPLRARHLLEHRPV
jgi:hypothetical protein